MGKEDSTQKMTLPKLVKLDNAYKLAELWVSKMSNSTEEESSEVELEGRPPGLGLGATVPRHSTVRPSNDPVERKLYAKLNVSKRNAARNATESATSAREGSDDKDDDDDDEDLDSRTNAFSKKRALPLSTTLQTKKKKK